MLGLSVADTAVTAVSFNAVVRYSSNCSGSYFSLNTLKNLEYFVAFALCFGFT